MKVLLVNPPQSFYPGSDLVSGNLPLGLMYMAAVLDKAGFEVEILDAFMFDAPPRNVGDTIEVGMTYEQLQQEIQKRKPHIIGIGNPFSTQIEHAKKVASVAKSLDPQVLTVVGGPHVTVMPKEFLDEAQAVDVAVIGEGEYTMLELAKAAAEKKAFDRVTGIAYRKNGKVTVTPPRPFIVDLDALPYPAYHLVDMEQYLNPVKIEYRSFKSRSISMITSRGCPYNCCFCSVHLHMGKTFRAHSPKYVADHIQYVIDKFGVKTLFFEDDNLTFDQKRFEAICDKMLERKINVNWETPNGIRADRLNLELLKKMKKSGCKSAFFGVESGDQYVLDNIIHKDLDLKRVEETVKLCKQIGLKSGAFFVIGFPGEKKENMERTVEFALRLKREYDVGMHLLVATPSYGTKLYEECLKKGYLKECLTPRALAEVRQTRGNPLIETEDFTAEEVKAIAENALQQYRKISLINTIKYPKTTLETLWNQPGIALRYIKNLFSSG
ncbi:MAG: B12-binding domain-containing radical SAM protein [Candidatus Bathyarchaeota archaeon]|nr:B12-binding domain-containing radical SAM protein [Candidatus Bathyarchaeota archaeon]